MAQDQGFYFRGGDLKDKILRKLDAALSPPPNYANYTYTDRLRRYFSEFLKNPARLSSLFHLVKLSLMILASYILLPVAIMLKLFGYRFSNIDLAQIGSVIYLDLFFREDALHKKTPRHKILLLASNYTDGNRYILDLYNEYGVFVRNPFVKLLLSPFFLSPIFKDNSFKYDLTFFTETVAHDIWNRYMEKYGGYLIEFPKTDIDKASAMLAKYLPKGQKFVCLHVRDCGFYNIKSQNTRNADIETYTPAVKYLIEKGYAVVRLGDDKMVNIDNMIEECGELLFDYAHSDIRSEIMDAYLLSHCEFYIGLASGPAAIPMLFGVNSCNVNWYNVQSAPNFLAGDITSFKKFRYKKDGSLVPFEKLLDDPFIRNPSCEELDKHGIYFEDNTEQEILDTVREFLETPRDHVSDLQLKAWKKISKNNYSYGARGHFSDTILREYHDNDLL